MPILNEAFFENLTYPVGHALPDNSSSKYVIFVFLHPVVITPWNNNVMIK